jgi:hypothetical protein
MPRRYGTRIDPSAPPLGLPDGAAASADGIGSSSRAPALVATPGGDDVDVERRRG